VSWRRDRFGKGDPIGVDDRPRPGVAAIVARRA
jgi:hypothetical protein